MRGRIDSQRSIAICPLTDNAICRYNEKSRSHRATADCHRIRQVWYTAPSHDTTDGDFQFKRCFCSWSPPRSSLSQLRGVAERQVDNPASRPFASGEVRNCPSDGCDYRKYRAPGCSEPLTCSLRPSRTQKHFFNSIVSPKGRTF